MHQRLLSLITVVLIAGCSSAPPQQADGFSGHLGTVAIISLIGNEISLHYAGSSNLNNSRPQSNVADWRLDNFAVRAASEYLTNRGHKVAHLRYKAAPLLKTYTNRQSNTDPHMKNIEPELRVLLNKYPANTFILIYRNETSDFVGDTDEKLFSLGLYNRSAIFGSGTTATYSSIRIDLVRTSDFSVPASAVGNAHTRINPNHWHSAYENNRNKMIPLKSSNRRKIMSFIQKDLKNSINGALKDLGL